MKKVLFVVLGIVMNSLAYAAPVTWDVNGHSYDFISSNISWNDAKSQAGSLGGYLAVITSSDENQFLLSNFATGQNSNFAWIGGWQYDKLEEPAGHWQWVTNESWNYTNWGGIEPNSYQVDEDYAMYNLGLTFANINAGQWGDARPVPSGADPVIGFLVERNTNVSPEPVSMLLFGMGGIAMVLIKRKKKI